jgi:hypothetical protein
MNNILFYQLTGTSGLPTYLGDCSTSGKASLTGGNIVINNLVKPTKLKAKIELQVNISFCFQRALGFNK